MELIFTQRHNDLKTHSVAFRDGESSLGCRALLRQEPQHRSGNDQGRDYGQPDVGVVGPQQGRGLRELARDMGQVADGGLKVGKGEVNGLGPRLRDGQAADGHVDFLDGLL